MLQEQGLCNILGLDCESNGLLDEWRKMALHLDTLVEEIRIAMVGKYTGLSDAYLSVIKSLQHAAMAVDRKLVIDWVEASHLEDDWQDAEESTSAWQMLKGADGILVPGGFGDRGIEGKINTIQYIRENEIPFFGICLGMQCAVIEYARNVLGLKDAHSSEMTSTKNAVIDLMESQKKVSQKGGTMRLGAYKCKLEKGSKSYTAYGKSLISERHRHRYEFNGKYLKDFEKAGMKAVGINPDNDLVEAVEIPTHPWFVGVQYHPELKSTVDAPHPLFVRFVKAALEKKEA
jgi:CTP synthase